MSTGHNRIITNLLRTTCVVAYMSFSFGIASFLIAIAFSLPCFLYSSITLFILGPFITFGRMLRIIFLENQYFEQDQKNNEME